MHANTRTDTHTLCKQTAEDSYAHSCMHTAVCTHKHSWLKRNLVAVISKLMHFKKMSEKEEEEHVKWAPIQNAHRNTNTNKQLIKSKTNKSRRNKIKADKKK